MNIIPHPEIENLKEELSQLIFEYDNLTKHICPQIERKYVLEFGLFEYKLYRLEFEIKKLKRKYSLIQIEINHGNEVDITKIDDILTQEFEEYEEKLQAQIDEIKFLEENEFKTLSDKDSKKLKKIYRMLIKRLHPDLNPNQTFFELNLFLRTTECFKNGDLKGLESITAILPEDSVEEISEIDNLKNLIKDFKLKITNIKKDYPYNKKNLLENRKSGDEYKDMLINLINDRKADIENIKIKINKLI